MGCVDNSEAVVKTYSMMHYSKNGSYGIRQKFDLKQQIFTVHKRGADNKDVKRIAENTLEKLNEGMSEEDASIYNNAALDKLKIG